MNEEEYIRLMTDEELIKINQKHLYPIRIKEYQEKAEKCLQKAKELQEKLKKLEGK